MAVCVACGLRIDDGVLSVDTCTDGAIGCGNTSGDQQCLYVKLQPGGGLTYNPAGVDQFGGPNGGLEINVAALDCGDVWDAIGSPVRSTAEVGQADVVPIGPFTGDHTNDSPNSDAQVLDVPTISTSITNPSTCKTMSIWASYYGGGVIIADATTVEFTLVFEENQNGNGWFSPFRMGIGYVGLTPRTTTEIRQESQGAGFFRRVATGIPPGGSYTYESRVAFRAVDVANGNIHFIDRVISLLGIVEF